LSLASLFVLLAWIDQFTIYRWLPSAPSGDVGNLLSGLMENPFLLALWLGPVVWIGVAGFEEVSRAFILDRLWVAWPGRKGRWIAVLLSVAIFSIAHFYQGIAGMISVGIMALISAVYYMRYGRIWPLIIAHALYDSFWIVFVVIQNRPG